MPYFWVCDRIAQGAYDVQWRPGQENLADYQSKHHMGAHHMAVRLWYLHKPTSPLFLSRAVRPSTLKGCVGTLPKGYVRNVPLPRVPKVQRARSHPVTMIPDYYKETYIVPTQDIPCSLAGDATYAPPQAWHAIAINT